MRILFDMSCSEFIENDPFAPIRYCYPVEDILYSFQTRHNCIKVFQSSYFGRILVLNDIVQLTEWDEYFYHEMLAHVSLHTHPSPADVLIIGGGDGGTLREVLKHENVKRAMLVEIDEVVMEVSKNFLPTLSVGFSDSRTHVVIMDGAEFLSKTSEKFDVIIVDSTDPVGTAECLFTEQFFENAFHALKKDGIFVSQTESLHFHRQFIRDVQNRLAKKFRSVDLYMVPLATYAGNWWTFSIASKRYNPKKPVKKSVAPTRYYAEDVHRHAFLPRSLYYRMVDCQHGNL